jgi:glycosyltransferase involved in cell wall biosynthesis
MKPALISVIIPFYNKSETILRSVNSVLSQTYSHWELIIIDDCGKEPLSEIELPKDDRIQTYHNYYNLGAGKTRQRGLNLANGEFVAFLDADDWWDENFLSLCLKALENSKVVDGAYVKTMVINKDGSQSLRRYCDQGHNRLRETLIQFARPWQTGGILWRRDSCGNWGNLNTQEDSWFEFTSAQNNILLPVLDSYYYVDMTGDNHLSKSIKTANSTKDQQELFLMVKKDFWKKLSVKYKIILLHRLIRGHFKIMEYCSLNEVKEYRRKLFKESFSLGLLSYSKFLLKVTHKILQNSPYKIHY